MKNYKVTTLIPARKKAEFMRKAENAESKKAIVPLAKTIANYYADKHNLSADDRKTLALSLFATGICVYNMKHSNNPYEYIINYIIWKQRIYERLNDLGAFGDSVETACHLINCRELWRVNIKNLHVSAIGKTDLQIHGVKFEVGINGKTLADSLPDDEMNGPFDGFIYGVFDETTTTEIINSFRRKDVITGLTTIAKNLYVFPNKKEFTSFMETIGRSNSIVWKPSLDRYQIVYNPSKHKAFADKVKQENIITLYKYIKQYGENDFLLPDDE